MPEIVARYDYLDAAGELVFQVERLRPKGFRQRRPDPNSAGWIYNLEGVERVLYRLPQVLEAVREGKRVFFVEGERDVHTLEAHGHVATTVPGGAGKWQDSYAEAVRGAKHVAVIADNDGPGIDHALLVASALDHVVDGEPKVWRPPDGCKDVTAMTAAGRPLKDLVPFEWRAELTARSDGANGNGHVKLEVLTAKQIMKLPTPDKSGELLGPLLYKGHRIVLGGHTGHGKTTLALHMIAAAAYGRQFLTPQWTGKGNLNVLVIDVEQGTRSVQRGIREVGLTESERVHFLRVPDGLALDSDAGAIAQMERMFGNNGYDLVMADPLYKLHRGDMNDSRAAVNLMRRFDDWRERFGFALLLPMHCRKPVMNQPLKVHDLFGSSGYQWGAEVLLGLERKAKNFAWLHFWKDREGDIAEVAPINDHWQITFDRESGFARAQESLSTLERCYAMLRDIGPLTVEEMRVHLWNELGARAPVTDTIRNVLNKADGVTHDGAKLIKDRRYQLPMTIPGIGEAMA